MIKKQKAAYLMLTIFLISLFTGAIYVIIFSDNEIILSGRIELTEFPPVIEEPPYPLTFVLIEKETGQTFYLAYQNQTLTNPKDQKFLDIYMQNIIIRGKTRYARSIDRTKEYTVIIVLETKKQ